MKHNEWICKEIDAWRSEGILDDSTAKLLQERYATPPTKHSLGIILAGCLGALLFGLGIISIFAANWDCLDRGARAAISLTPVILCGALAFLGALKSWKGPAFWEPLGIIWAISVGAATALIAQTYQLSGSVPGLILFIALLTLPIVWITGSMGTMMAWPIIPLVWFAAQLDNVVFTEETNWLGCRTLAFFALSLPAYVAFLKRKPSRPALLTAQIVTGFIFSCGLGWILGFSFHEIFDHHWEPEFFVMMFWLSALILGASAWFFKLPAWRLIAVLVASGAALCAPFVAFWLFAMALALAIGITAYGIKNLRLSYTNIGACLLLWQILMKFLESELDFTIKGIVLIACGIALTAFNVFFIRYRKSRQEVTNEQQA